MKGVALLLVLTAELVLCNEHGLREPQSFYQQAIDVGNAYVLGQKYEILKSMVVFGDLAGEKPNIPDNYWGCKRGISLNEMRNSAFDQIYKIFRVVGPPENRTGKPFYDHDETNKVVAFWDGVRFATQFTIDVLNQFELQDTKFADSIPLAKKRRVEASKQFVAALLFGSYDERPDIWEYTYEARSKLNKYKTQDEKDTESIKLGFIALIKEHRLAKELVSKSLEKLPATQLLFVYGMLCKVEKERSDSASTIGSGWTGILKLLESHAPRIDERCDSWAFIATLLDRRFNHLLGEVLERLQECVAVEAKTSVEKHGSAEALISSSSGSPRRSPTRSSSRNPNNRSGSQQRSPTRSSSRNPNNRSASP